MITIGIDEVGRGCWAGPLVAGAVILPSNFALEDGPLKPRLRLRDSKKLTKKQREQLTVIIEKQAVAVGLGWVWPEEIDADGVTWAVKTAMQRAVAAIRVSYDKIIIDGNINYLVDDPRSQAIIKADDTVPAVSAASIVAKVARDHYMADIAQKYPGYGFEHHVGYGTALHIEQLKLRGVSDIHRRSYKPVRAVLEWQA